MCLSVKNLTRNVAETDIVCYKMLLTVKDTNNTCSGFFIEQMNGAEYLSPYRHAPYDIGKRYESTLDIPKKSYSMDDDYSVHNGLHTFSELSDAIMIRNLTNKNFGPVVVECRIPKGAEFYSGIFENIYTGSAKSYASNSLIVDEVVP